LLCEEKFEGELINLAKFVGNFGTWTEEGELARVFVSNIQSGNPQISIFISKFFRNNF
jgi:hypothetical protein